MKATLASGDLQPINNCYILLPTSEKIVMKILPEITDSKSASYNDEPIIGRSFPLKTYSHSENRTISWTIHLMVIKEGDQEDNMKILRALESCVYPDDANSGGAPYSPPHICEIACGSLLTSPNTQTPKPLCAVMKSYTVKFPSDVVWDDRFVIPHKFDIDLQFDVVYSSSDLPGQDQIFQSGG